MNIIGDKMIFYEESSKLTKEQIGELKANRYNNDFIFLSGEEQIATIINNCLCYALRFWNNDRKYKLYYNSNHVINLHRVLNESELSNLIGYLPAEAFGYTYFLNAFREYLDDYHLNLLKKYFNINE